MRVNPIMNITGQMPYQKHARKPTRKPRGEAESVWARYGSDEDYKAWCRTRPSAYNPRNTPSNSKIEYCHYRTASNSGIAIKPPYSGIPMTMQEHQIQHRVGTFSFMERERWEYLVLEHLKAWARSTGKPLHWKE